MWGMKTPDRKKGRSNARPFSFLSPETPNLAALSLE
jgi:hypothetical protein